MRGRGKKDKVMISEVGWENTRERSVLLGGSEARSRATRVFLQMVGCVSACLSVCV